MKSLIRAYDSYVICKNLNKMKVLKINEYLIESVLLGINSTGTKWKNTTMLYYIRFVFIFYLIAMFVLTSTAGFPAAGYQCEVSDIIYRILYRVIRSS